MEEESKSEWERRICSIYQNLKFHQTSWQIWIDDLDIDDDKMLLHFRTGVAKKDINGPSLKALK